MTSKEALEYIKKYGVWQFSSIHGLTTTDTKLIKSFKTIEKELDALIYLKVKWICGDMEIKNITPDDIEDFCKTREVLEND